MCGLLTLAAAVFTIAVATRVPVIAESFWVDELHSAWTVGGTLGEVRQRAAQGNQTPLYYWGLWCWRQGVGEGELAMRISSVIASALACAVVAAGVAKLGGGVLGGAVAGLFLALEANSIFFGTELRVFAVVLLLASIVCWSWSEVGRGGGRIAGPVMMLAIFLAALIQPMSLGVLVWPAIVEGTKLALTLVREHRLRLAPRTALLGAAAALLLGWLAWDLAGRVWWFAWQHRDQWQAVGAVRSGQQLLRIWPWGWILIAPVVAAWAAWACERFGGGGTMPAAADTATASAADGEEARGASRAGFRLWGPPAAVAVGATLFYWSVSASGLAAIFHRRYLIAALPLLAWAGGAAVGQAGFSLAKLWRLGDRNTAERRFSATVIGGLWVWALIAAWPLLQHGIPLSARLRGEDWRGAAAYLRANAAADTAIWLSPGLIETERCLASGQPEDIAYLAYPLRGPYRLEGVEVISLRPAGIAAPLRQRLTSGEAWYAVVRAPKRLAEQWGRIIVDRAKPRSLQWEIAEFGGVHVIRFESR